MTYKDILAPIISLEEDEAALVAAGELATIFGTRAVALIVAVHLASSYADEPHTLSEVLSDIAAGSRSSAAQRREKVVEWLGRAAHDFEVRDVQVEGAVDQGEAEAHARVADLVVMARAAAHQRARRALIERILFSAQRPLLLTPDRPIAERKWERFVIGWNAKAEAMRAVTAALPLLQRAKQVVVATVDARPSAVSNAQAPGQELAQYLSRHGVTAEVRNLDSMGREVEGALLAQTSAIGADALILGAYGHSRAREFLFGGVTRALLAASPVPLLLCH